MNKKELYLDDYSMEDIIDILKFIKTNENNENENEDEETEPIEDKSENKPSFSIKPNFNSKGEKIVVFSINIPLKKNGLKIDILINNTMYKNIGRHFK
jgi:hypothetical protein